MGQDRQRRGIVKRRRNLIPHKWSAEGERNDLALSRGESRPVAGEHLSCRFETECRGGVLAGDGFLKANEKEQLVSQNRAAQGSPKLISFQPIGEPFAVRPFRSIGRRI